MGHPVKKDSLLFSFSRHFRETPQIIPNPACLQMSLFPLSRGVIPRRSLSLSHY